MYDYRNLRIGTLYGRAHGGCITVENIIGPHNNTGYCIDIMMMFVNNGDGYGLITNQFDSRDISVIGIDNDI
jgi:hypothetical protein